MNICFIRLLLLTNDFTEVDTWLTLLESGILVYAIRNSGHITEALIVSMECSREEAHTQIIVYKVVMTTEIIIRSEMESDCFVTNL